MAFPHDPRPHDMNPDFGQYYEAREPGRRERAYGWGMASALNSLDKFRL